MKNALTRNLRLGISYLTITAGQLVVSCIALKIWFLFLDLNRGSFSLDDTFFIATTLIIFTGIFSELSWFSTFYKSIIGCSISRETFYMVSLVIKTGYALVGAVAFAIANSIDTVFPLPPLTILLGSFVIVFTLECFGDFYGIVLNKYAKCGLILFLVSFLGAIFWMLFYVGYFFVTAKVISFAAFGSSVFSSTVLLGFALISLVFLVVNWFLIKTSEIRS